MAETPLSARSVEISGARAASARTRRPTQELDLRSHSLADGVFHLENWLPYEFSFVANRVSAMLQRMYGQRFGLSVVGWRVLAILNNASPLSAKEVAERSAMSPVNVSRAVAHLMLRGMVRRIPDKRDTRKVMLSPSAKGASAYRLVLPLAEAIEDEILGKLSAKERSALRQMMRKVARSAAAGLPASRDWRTLVRVKG